MELYLYIAGGVLVVLSLFIGRGRSHSFRARDVSGAVIIVGDNTGDVKHSAPSAPPAKASGDHVAWGIAIVGVLVAAAGVVLSQVKP